jgi:hypothetical protein
VPTPLGMWARREEHLSSTLDHPRLHIHVEDPGAFNMPWNAIQRYRRTEGGPLVEMVCAENNSGYFDYDVVPLPHADKPDF